MTNNVQEYVQMYHSIAVGTKLRLTKEGQSKDITVSGITAYVTYNGQDAACDVLATDGNDYSLGNYDDMTIL